jgi:hypothetical protein
MVGGEGRTFDASTKSSESFWTPRLAGVFSKTRERFLEKSRTFRRRAGYSTLLD